MRKMLMLRLRFSALLIGLLTMATLAALPFSAQPLSGQQAPPFDESRMIADLTNQLQLAPEQVSALSSLLKQRLPRIEGMSQKMQQFLPGSPQFGTPTDFQFDVAPDGQQFAMTTAASASPPPFTVIQNWQDKFHR